MKIYVLPVEGREVFDPLLGDLIPREGRLVDRNAFWLRRIKDGDVIERQVRKEKK